MQTGANVERGAQKGGVTDMLIRCDIPVYKCLTRTPLHANSREPGPWQHNCVYLRIVKGH